MCGTLRSGALSILGLVFGRWPRVIVGVIGGLGALSALVWFVWLPHYRPNLHAGEQYGVDVSAHQGHINWPKVARNHIAFA